MKMKLLVTLVMAAGLAACGGKAKKATTPDNSANTTEPTGNGSGSATGANGGASYGGATAPAGDNGSATAPAPAGNDDGDADDKK